MIKTVSLKDVKKSKGKTDWNYLKSSKEIPVNDPDSPPMKEHELRELKKAEKIEQGR